MIKKLITGTALIVAGTALAGAATEYTTVADTITASTDWGTTYYGNYYAFLFNTDNISLTGSSASSLSEDTIETGLTYEVSSISLALNTYTQSKASSTAMVVLDSTTYEILGVSTSTTYSTAYFANNSAKAQDIYAFDGLYITSGTTYIAVGVTLGAAETLVVGTILTEEDYASICSYLRLLGGTYTSETDGCTDETSFTSATYGTMDVTVQYVLTQVEATIPEPSAFGILAGFGALALAASRRRRSRKAA